VTARVRLAICEFSPLLHPQNPGFFRGGTGVIVDGAQRSITAILTPLASAAPRQGAPICSLERRRMRFLLSSETWCCRPFGRNSPIQREASGGVTHALI